MEFNEQTFNALKQVLAATVHHDQAVVKDATAKLNANDKTPGFRLCLLQSVLIPDCPALVAQAGALYLKNSLKQFFRLGSKSKANKNKISDELRTAYNNELKMLQECLLTIFTMENRIPKVLQTQLLLIIAKTCRSCWPRNWGNLFPTVLQSLQSQNTVVRYRYVEKEDSRVRSMMVMYIVLRVL